MHKNQSINVVVRFIGQALRMFNKPVLPVPSIEGNIVEALSDYNDMLNKLSDYNMLNKLSNYNDMLNKLSDYNSMLDELSDYTVDILIEYCKRDLIYA